MAGNMKQCSIYHICADGHMYVCTFIHIRTYMYVAVLLCTVELAQMSG